VLAPVNPAPQSCARPPPPPASSKQMQESVLAPVNPAPQSSRQPPPPLLFKRLYERGVLYDKLPEGCDWKQLTSDQLRDQLKVRKCKVKLSRMSKGGLLELLLKIIEEGSLSDEIPSSNYWSKNASARLLHVLVDEDTRDAFLDSGIKSGKRFWKLALAKFNDNDWNPRSITLESGYATLDPSQVKLPQPASKMKGWYRKIVEEFKLFYTKYEQSGNHGEGNFWELCRNDPVQFYLFKLLEGSTEELVLKMVLDRLPNSARVEEGTGLSDEDYKDEKSALLDESSDYTRNTHKKRKLDPNMKRQRRRKRLKKRQRRRKRLSHSSSVSSSSMPSDHERGREPKSAFKKQVHPSYQRCADQITEFARLKTEFARSQTEQLLETKLAEWTTRLCDFTDRLSKFEKGSKAHAMLSKRIEAIEKKLNSHDA